MQLMMVVTGVLATAFAQILIKKASFFDIKTTPWLIYMGVSAVFYASSFILYSQILKFYPLNKIYPAMTVAQLILITIYGLWIGEVIDLKHAIGLLFGLASIFLILS